MVDTAGTEQLKVKRPDYFLVSVSTRNHLELCLKYSLAGFLGSGNGLWTFCEIQEGDYLSFLYGARVHNLYHVVGKHALVNQENVPPWPSVTFTSGLTYWFPFRLVLQPVRQFNEPLVRDEFAYVAENLLLRGGYRRTHFQADQTTLQFVSQTGTTRNNGVERLMVDSAFYVPRFLRTKSELGPGTFQFSEKILQAAVRHRLSKPDGCTLMFTLLHTGASPWPSLEALGEKALPQGNVDILVKNPVSIGRTPKVPVEVKLNRASRDDVRQLRGYMDELGSESLGGMLIASSFPKDALPEADSLGISTVRYSLGIDMNLPQSFEEVCANIKLHPAGDV